MSAGKDDRSVNIDEKVAAASAALARGEDANWELARLTWESTHDRPGPLPTGSDRVTMDTWCRMIRERSGRRFGAEYGKDFRAVWSHYGDRSPEERPLFNEAYAEVKGRTETSVEVARAQSEARRIAADPSLLKPEQKRELIVRLAEDPAVRDDWQSRARLQRMVHEGDRIQEERRQEFRERDPISQKVDGMRAAIGLEEALVRGEDANWELARLTWESTVSPNERPSSERTYMADWCRMIRERSGRRFSEPTGFHYKRVWSIHLDRDQGEMPSWMDAYETTRSASPER